MNYKSVFYNKTANIKYNIVYLLDCIMFMLKSGVSYKGLKQMVSVVSNFNDNIVFPHYSTIYRFYTKLIKYNIISTTFNNLVRSYLNRTKSNNIIKKTKFCFFYYVDTTLIPNKCG